MDHRNWFSYRVVESLGLCVSVIHTLLRVTLCVWVCGVERYLFIGSAFYHALGRVLLCNLQTPEWWAFVEDETGITAWCQWLPWEQDCITGMVIWKSNRKVLKDITTEIWSNKRWSNSRTTISYNMFFSSSFFRRFTTLNYHFENFEMKRKKEIAEETCLNRSLNLCLLNFAATYYNVKVVNLNRYVNNFHNIYSIF